MIETEGLIKKGMDSTADKEYQNISQGTDTSGLLNGGSGFNDGLNFGNDAMTQAIRQKYSKPFQVQQQGLQNKMKLDARNEHFTKIHTAHQLANEEANLNFQKEMIKYKQKMQKKAMRGQIISTVLSLGGAVAGGVVGGPVGAMAGYGGGAMAGQAIGEKIG